MIKCINSFTTNQSPWWWGRSWAHRRAPPPGPAPSPPSPGGDSSGGSPPCPTARPPTEPTGWAGHGLGAIRWQVTGQLVHKVHRLNPRAGVWNIWCYFWLTLCSTNKHFKYIIPNDVPTDTLQLVRYLIKKLNCNSVFIKNFYDHDVVGWPSLHIKTLD